MTEAERLAWNAAIEAGDRELIEALKEKFLRELHQRFREEDDYQGRTH